MNRSLCQPAGTNRRTATTKISCFISVFLCLFPPCAPLLSGPQHTFPPADKLISKQILGMLGGKYNGVLLAAVRWRGGRQRRSATSEGKCQKCSCFHRLAWKSGPALDANSSLVMQPELLQTLFPFSSLKLGRRPFLSHLSIGNFALCVVLKGSDISRVPTSLFVCVLPFSFNTLLSH